MSQITGVSSAEYPAKTTKTQESASQKPESASEETKVKLTVGASAGTVKMPAATTTDTSDYEAILAKANSGQTLTSSELSVLKAKNPAAYAKAVRTDTARQELTSRMEKSPNQANRVLDEALSSLSEKNDSNRETLTKALTAEYNNFVSKHDQVIIGER
jgi:hypothetical protein